MTPVATHPPGVPEPFLDNSALLASNSRANSVSADIVAAASAKDEPEPLSLEDLMDSKGNRNRRQAEAASILTPEHKHDSAQGMPSFDEVSEFAFPEAAPEIRESLASPGVQAQHRAHPGDAYPDGQTSPGNTTTSPEIHASLRDGDQSRLSPGTVEQSDAHEANETDMNAASPASSSEDAPGSDYDDFDDREPVFDAAAVVSKPPVDPEKLSSRGPPYPAEGHAKREEADDQGLNTGLGVSSANTNKEEHSAGAKKEKSHEAEIEARYMVGTMPAAKSQASAVVKERPSDSSAGDKACEPKANASEDTAHIGKGEETSLQFTNQAPEPMAVFRSVDKAIVVESEHQPEESGAVASFGATNPLTRTSDDNEGSSPKRQKVVDMISGVDSNAAQTVPTEASPQAALKSHPAKKKAAAKPKAAPKQRAPPKPKKDSKANVNEEAEQPVGRTVAAVSTEPGANSMPVPESEQYRASEVPKPGENKAKRARRPTLGARRQPVRPAAVSEETPQTPPMQAAEVQPSVAEQNAAPAFSLTDASDAATADLAAKGKAKAKSKPKAPSKAKGKGKGKVDPAESAEGHVPVEAMAKPAPVRTTTKKGKGPVAKLVSASADGAVSELELEPNQQPIAAVSSQVNIETVSEDAFHQDGRGSEPQDRFLGNDHGSALAEQVPSGNTGEYLSTNIFASMRPQMYPAQAYYPTRSQAMQQQNRGMSTLTSAVAMSESEMQWSELSAARPGSTSSGYEGMNEATSPTTIGNTAGSVAGDGTSDSNLFSPSQSMQNMELDPRIYPAGWRAPFFDLTDPDLLMTGMRDRTVWTFWDCYLPLGCRDQDMVLMSNDGIAFPCAAWNPCLFSTVLNRVIKNPGRTVRAIMQRGASENRKLLGYSPLPCIAVDENWQATNLLLSFLHPIPTMFLPDRATCRLVMDIGMRYGVDRAMTAATQRLDQIDQEERASKAKGKGRSTEEEIAADLAERTAEASRR